MALVLNDRVKETTTTTGTGTVNLGGAETGFETFVAGVGNGNTTYYCITAGAEFEVGLGTVTDASPDTLSRTTILSSSNSDSAVDFSAGTKDVFCTLPASKAVFEDASSNVTLPGIITAVGTSVFTNLDISGDVDVDGTLEADAMTLNSTAITTTATLDTGISNNNVPKFTSGVADDDFLRVNGTAIEGRSASEVLSDIGASAAAGSSSIVTTGALDSGSITSGFGTINNGSSTITTTGAITGGSLVADNITIDGTEIDLSSGNLTIDVAGDIALDCGGGDINLQDDGTQFGSLENDGTNFIVKSERSNADMLFKGNDGGSGITALTLDMSEAGAATFNNNVTAFSDERLKDNIETLEDGLDKVEQLRGVTYTRDGKENIGVIAQEVEKILPEIVLTADDEMGTKSVDYSRITAVLIEAVKELSVRVKELENK